MRDLTHATIEKFDKPGGAIRFFDQHGYSHKTYDPFREGFALCWVDESSIEVKAVARPWTKKMFRLAILAAREFGAERIGFRRVRKDGSLHFKWYETR